VSLNDGSGGFGIANLAVANFGLGAGGWSSQDAFPRYLADVNGDGKADIVGFSYAGVYVPLATGGGNFAAPILELGDFAPGAGGWTYQDAYTRQLADVNGDGMADIVGFGQSGVWISLATGGGPFAQPTFDLSNFGAAQGWTNDNIYHRELANVTGGGSVDLVGFGQIGVYVASGYKA
jgi:hypothetical protein